MSLTVKKNSRSKLKRSSDVAVKTLAVVGVGALALHAARLYLKLFGPALPYKMENPPDDILDSDRFLRFLSVITGAAYHRDSRIDVLKNGDEIYASELDAIRHARKTVNLEFYEFLEGEIAGRFLDALSERARAGIAVKVVIDAMGSFGTHDSYFDGVRAAGGRVEWFHPLRWDTWPYANNRTHRKLIVTDGEIGFVGGAGISDEWLKAGPWGPPWRDTMLRVQGEAVAGLVSVMAQNWLACSGEILSGVAQFPFAGVPGTAACLVIDSTPASGATKARILFQTLLDCAQRSIRITTPYFLPDRSVRRALLRAIRRRKVRVQVITAGPGSDHPSISKLSKALSLDLLKAGAEIHEYQPGMIHAKLMTIDGMWSVAGSTNFDDRSFALNDEVNFAVLDRDLAARLDEDFEGDLARSALLTLEELKQRSLSIRAMDSLSWVIKREE